jgi:hypothetical protein
MRTGKRFCCLSLALAVSLPVISWSAPAPTPRRAKPSGGPALAVSYRAIRMGMTENELHALMAPYRNLRTGHGQWPAWTDGRTTVLLTVMPDDPLSDEVSKVREKKLFRNAPDGTHSFRDRCD